MRRDEVQELHFITLIENVPSILEFGMLSHNRVHKLNHRSIALRVIQDRRKDKNVPGGRSLHDYANLYFDAHNAMLSKLREKNDEICVLHISQGVLDLPDVVISDRNASSNWARFYTVNEGLLAIDRDKLYATYWTHPDPREEMEHKSLKCAEVLVPDCIAPACIQGAYVANNRSFDAFKDHEISLSVKVRRSMFFRG